MIIRKVIFLASMVAFLGILFSEAASAQSLKQQLVGTWKVASATMQIGEEKKPVPLGTDIIGFIMYNPDGYMCFTAMSASRPKFGSGDRAGGTAEQRAAAFESYRSTCGRYEVVNEQDRIISHSFEVSLTPDFTGQIEKRFVKELSGDKLILETIPHILKGQKVTGVWTYQRVK
jgi:hypothetical protein